MNRRTLLKTGALAGIASLIPSSLIFAQTKATPSNGNKVDLSGFKKLPLGELDLFILSDGYIRDKNIEGYAPRADVAKLKSILKDNFRSEEHIDMAMNVLLVKTADKLILLDSGLGIFADEISGFLLQSLVKAGFKPEQITDVFISHAHPDHVGGLTDKNGNLVFQNAKYHISKIEFDFWMKATVADFKNSGLVKQLDFVKGLIPPIQNILTKIKPKINYYDYSKALYENFNFISAPGHTPGMTLTKIKSGNEELVVVADLIHSDILLFPHPEWGYSGDTDLDIAIASRKKILAELSDSQTKMIGYHLPWSGIGHVKKVNGAYQWYQEAFYTP